jgi:group I intron endonuclease
MTIIYTLNDETGKVRYVGKTARSLEKRLYIHLTDARRKNRNNHRLAWIRSMLKVGNTPTIHYLDSDEGNGSAKEQYWIKRFIEDGCDLVNATIGGDGPMLGQKHTPEAKIKMSLKAKERFRHQKQWNYGKPAHNKGKGVSEETRLKIRAARLRTILAKKGESGI